MPSRSEVDLLAGGLNAVVEAARSELSSFWAGLELSDLVSARQQLEVFYPQLVSAYGEAAAVAALDWVESVMGGRGVLSGVVSAERATARMRWAMGHAFSGDNARALDSLLFITDELVKEPGRSTVVASAKHRGVRFARVPSGAETCAWCLMLASRGYVYGSAESAGAAGGFHPDCDCMVVPDDGVVPGGYDPEALAEMYQDADGAGKEKLASMRSEFGLK